MQVNKRYKYIIHNPNFDNMRYIVAIANIDDKHDRSAPSHYHWKILKCRMLIFSNSSILACPDKKDVKQVHIVFNILGDEYDKLNSLFLKFSLVQNGPIKMVTQDVFLTCFEYTMTAKLAPIWNAIGYKYLINNRDFLTTKGPQEAVEYFCTNSENILYTTLELKPVKINLMQSNDDFYPGEWIRVLPSLNKAIVENRYESLPEGDFKSFKDLRRHWKNIHGYRLPEVGCPFYMVQFWRGDPLTYPKYCVVRHYPIITPVPKTTEKEVLASFLSCLKAKMPHILGVPLTIENEIVHCDANAADTSVHDVTNERFGDSQAVSLCTPTQYVPKFLITRRGT